MTSLQEPQIYQTPINLPDEEHLWVVAHVRPRCEKKLGQFCGQRGISFYLPLRRDVHSYGGRTKAFLKPLFPGYVFCMTDHDGVGSLRQNRYVANLLDVADQALLVRQLRQIEYALSVDDALEIMPYLEEGRPVRVISGPFKGLEGKVCRIKGRTKVVINVDMIQKSVPIELEKCLLGPG